jgi:hypothetical protein
VTREELDDMFAKVKSGEISECELSIREMMTPDVEQYLKNMADLSPAERSLLLQIALATHIDMDVASVDAKVFLKSFTSVVMAMCDAFKENEELQAIVADNTFSEED